MTESYGYNREFRLKILSLMLDNMWMARNGVGIIVPEYFEKDDEELVAKGIIEYRNLYNVSPADSDDLVTLVGGYEELIYDLYDMRLDGDVRLASDMVIQFAKEQAVKLAILESVDDISKGDLSSPLERMREAVAIGDSLLSPGIDPIADISKWLYSYWDDKVPTGWYHVDRDLGGGLGVPELGVILGPMNRGKSMALINIGYAAASILGRKNVVHFTHEMKIDQVAKRYAARLCFKFPDKNSDLSVYEDKLLASARKLLPGKIRIIGGAGKMTTREMESHLNRLDAEDFDIGLIIDDYPDLLVPPRRYKERRFEISATYEFMRGLSEKFGCPVWGASQGTRASLSKEIITMADIAEDINKAAIADVIIALCQTREEEESDLCRLFTAKVRDSSGKRLYRAKYYSKQQAIITTGIVEKKKEENV